MRSLLFIIVFCFLSFMFFSIDVFLNNDVSAQNKVVVVPLGNDIEANLIERFVNVETSYTWNCPPDPTSAGFVVECPASCIAVGGACSAKTVGDATDVVVTSGNFSKTNVQLPKYNAYECYMYALSCMDPGDPPVGYAQVVCYCDR